MLRRLAQIFLVIPLAVLLIVFAVANRHIVTISLDPFGAAAPGWSVSMPLFILVFIALVLGVLVGGVAAWLNQAKWRRRARREHAEAARWRHRAGEAPPASDPETRSIVPVMRQGS